MIGTPYFLFLLWEICIIISNLLITYCLFKTEFLIVYQYPNQFTWKYLEYSDKHNRYCILTKNTDPLERFGVKRALCAPYPEQMRALPRTRGKARFFITFTSCTLERIFLRERGLTLEECCTDKFSFRGNLQNQNRVISLAIKKLLLEGCARCPGLPYTRYSCLE